MLKKILKYDFISFKFWIIPYCATIILAILSGLLNLSDFQLGGAVIELIYRLLIVLDIFGMIFFLYAKYYTNYFSKEGYLMHTLPIKPRLLFLSKFISGFVGIICSVLIVGISYAIYHTIICGFSALNSTTTYVGASYYLMGPFYFIAYNCPFIVAITYALTYLMCFQLLGYASISLNHIFFKNNKILSISIIGFILLIIEHLLFYILYGLRIFEKYHHDDVMTYTLSLIISYIIFSYAYVFISCKTLKKHINLS